MLLYDRFKPGAQLLRLAPKCAREPSLEVVINAAATRGDDVTAPGKRMMRRVRSLSSAARRSSIDTTCIVYQCAMSNALMKCIAHPDMQWVDENNVVRLKAVWAIYSWTIPFSCETEPRLFGRTADRFLI
jgi:hypothetical protein